MRRRSIWQGPPSVLRLEKPSKLDATSCQGRLDDPLRQDTTEPIEVFFLYSHKDEKLREQLEKHLALLKRAGVITGWHDRRINAGREWAGEISEHLESAQIILLLVSPSYLGHWIICMMLKCVRALERHERGEARVIPIIIRPADWQGESFGKFQVLPRTATPITSWGSSDEAFASVANGIREAIDDLKLVYVYTVTKPGGMSPLDFNIYINLLEKMRVNTSNASRISEPDTSRRWLYVWNTRLEAEGFAKELQRQTGDTLGLCRSCSRSNVSKGPIAPLEINAIPTISGTAFRLHPQSLERILKSHPNTRLSPEVFWSLEDECPDITQTNRQSWDRLALLLTGLSQEQLDQLGGFRVLVLEPSGRDLLCAEAIRSIRPVVSGGLDMH